MNKNELQFSQLVNMDNPDAVLEEVKNNFIHYYPIREFASIRMAFKYFNDLYDGAYPGYLKCNTKYHDKVHTTDALLTISRLMDGYNIKNTRKIPLEKAKVALIATVMHDTGYIQRKGDTKGTGAKYTLSHVERSVVFLRNYLKKFGYPQKDFIAARNIIRCTGLFTNMASIDFANRDEKILGYMLGTSDLLGQMAARTYLERLVHLYREFKEGNVGGYTSEFDLLKKTLKFYDMIKARLEKDFDRVDRYALFHFQKRYHINKNLYHISILRHITHLKSIIQAGEKGYRSKLRRRSGIPL